MKIVEAADSDRPALALAMASGFSDHPYYAYMQSAPARRKKMVQWIQDRSIAYGLRYGVVFTDEKQVGASVWLTPDASSITMTRMVRTGLVLAPFKMGWSGFRKFMKLSSLMEEIKDRHMSEPHYMLLSVAVDPQSQGAGTGTALVKAGTDLAADAGVPCYVETMIERNVPWYERQGFEVVGEADVQGVGVMRALVRPVKAR